MLKVRIDKAEKETFWYSNKIGQEFNVENWIGYKEWYRCTFDAKGILKSDCTVLQSDTQPEQWVPKVGEFVIAFANPIRREFWGHTGKCIISEECYYVFEFNKEEQVDRMLSGVRKALPNEIPAPEPSSKAILDNSPKLIAKAGECNEWCGLNHCDTNGCSNRERILVEPVQVDTPIERIGVGVEDIIKYIENDAEIAIPINDFFNEDGSHITKKQYGHILLKYLCIELREKFSTTKPIE